MTEVLILGGGGMLGSMLVRVLGQHSDLAASATARRSSAGGGGVTWWQFEAIHDELGPLLDTGHYQWIINAIGVIKPRIDPQVPQAVEQAIAVNSLFPHRLAAEAARRNQRVIQIATDGVFSGLNPPYDESTSHDPPDVYAQTKSLGEVRAENVSHLRCSIIGPEPDPARSLLARMLGAPQSAVLEGYEGQRWNGITSLHFAKLCLAIIAGAELPPLLHVVPADTVSKADLLELIAESFGRHDLTIDRVPGPEARDRTLTTQHPESLERLWALAGYGRAPAIAAMVRELADFERHPAAPA